MEIDISYGFKRELNLTYEESVERVKKSLTENGFGILTEIDVKTTFKKKLDVDFDKYIILGACSAPNAYKILSKERDIGLLLPCNVVVYELEGRIFVSAIDPIVSMSIINNPDLEETAKTVRENLKKVILEI